MSLINLPLTSGITGHQNNSRGFNYHRPQLTIHNLARHLTRSPLRDSDRLLTGLLLLIQQRSVSSPISNLHDILHIRDNRRRIANFHNNRHRLSNLRVTRLTSRSSIQILPRSVLRDLSREIHIHTGLALIRRAATITIRRFSQVLGNRSIIIPLNINSISR